ncbi:hypothetical protein LZ31DRAFT_495 [Colletotrichum somersetense]|nr:hypothetical protein LZ31DRAFT_495 [Colletotrichum somersetense]
MAWLVWPGWPPLPNSKATDSFLLSQTLLVPPVPQNPCRAGLRHGVAARSMSGGDARARSGQFLSVGSVMLAGSPGPGGGGGAPRVVDAGYIGSDMDGPGRGEGPPSSPHDQRLMSR